MKYAFKVAIHLTIVLAGFILAYALRRGLGPEWWLTNPQARLVIFWAVGYAALAGLLEAFFRIERTTWRYSSAREVIRLAQSTGLTSLFFLAAIFLSNRGISLPRSTLLLSWLLSLCGLVGVRLLWRLAFDRSLAMSLLLPGLIEPKTSARPLVIVGDASQADAFLRRHAAEGYADYRPIAIIGRDAGLRGQFLHGIPVTGIADEFEGALYEAARRTRSTQPLALLFLRDPVLELGLTSQQIGRLRAEGVQLLRLPSMAELKQKGAPALRELKLEEFLPRKPVSLDPAPIQQLVRGRRVLVTGAGGSIGSEICRQLVGFGCAHISLIDHSEFLLFEIEREIAALQQDGTRRALLCNVRDGARVQAVFEEERPDIVFHAAALKHVTLVEGNPGEGVLTNVKGTMHVVEASRACGAGQMVLISTDKAVDPTSIMGATKRIAESLLPRGSTDTRFCAVRFGNVLGSAGSVVPIFRKQIEQGGPVTVTDPNVQRYFMTIPEAVQLVLHATVLSAASPSEQPRKFTLEMGEPVKIIDLARQMIEIYGLKADRDIEIQITGLKPGEKMSEALIDEDEVVEPCMDFISEIVAEADGRDHRKAVDRLIATAEGAKPANVADKVLQTVAVIRGDDAGRGGKIERLAQA